MIDKHVQKLCESLKIHYYGIVDLTTSMPLGITEVKDIRFTLTKDFLEVEDYDNVGPIIQEELERKVHEESLHVKGIGLVLTPRGTYSMFVTQ